MGLTHDEMYPDWAAKVSLMGRSEVVVIPWRKTRGALLRRLKMAHDDIRLRRSAVDGLWFAYRGAWPADRVARRAKAASGYDPSVNLMRRE